MSGRLLSNSRSMLALAAVGLVLSACGGASTPTDATAADAADAGTAALPTGACSPGANITSTQFTPSFVMVLDVGPHEPMYTKKQTAAQSPTSGEIMLGGTMMTQDDMGGMSGMDGDMGMGGSTAPTSADTKHLVVRICHRDEGEVVTDATPEIHVTDTTAGGKETALPVAKMQGIGEGTDDIHYGNEMAMPSGHTFAIEVHLDDEAATFQVSVP